jgi:hypothetical protein
MMGLMIHHHADDEQVVGVGEEPQPEVRRIF